MTWHLKDRELEEKLNKTSHPMHTFTDELNKEMDQIPKDSLKTVLGVVVIFKRIGTGGVILENNILKFSIEELVNIPEYDPHNWNKYPEVTPPEYVWMRLEIRPDSPVAGRVCAKFKNGKWFLDDGTVENFGDYPARFRPWED